MKSYLTNSLKTFGNTRSKSHEATAKKARVDDCNTPYSMRIFGTIFFPSGRGRQISFSRVWKFIAMKDQFGGLARHVSISRSVRLKRPSWKLPNEISRQTRSGVYAHQPQCMVAHQTWLNASTSPTEGRQKTKYRATQPTNMLGRGSSHSIS